MENPAIKWGVFYGIASIASMLIFYLVDPRLIFSIHGYIGFVLMILFPVLACREQRSETGGYASFGEMFKTGFITLIVASLIGTLFQYIFMNFIDPGLIEIQNEISIQAMEKMGSLLGEERLEIEIEKLENSNPVGPDKMALAFAFMSVIAAIVAAIIGAIMQKKNPADF